LRVTSTLEVVTAWARAMDDFDEEALIALAHEDFELVTRGGTRRGHDALRGWLGKQTYGLAPRFESRRVFIRGDAVVADLNVEFLYVDGGEPAGSQDLAVGFAVQDGLMRRITTHPDLRSALSASGLGEADEADLP
jgi:SnoaL-like domain